MPEMNDPDRLFDFRQRLEPNESLGGIVKVRQKPSRLPPRLFLASMIAMMQPRPSSETEVALLSEARFRILAYCLE